MRIFCENGFYKFFPETALDIPIFERKNKVSLTNFDGDYSFSAMKFYPRFSILGQLYGSLPALATYAGRYADLFKANGFVYSLKLGQVVPKALVALQTVAYTDGAAFMSSGELPQAGALDKKGYPISGFSARCDVEFNWFKIDRFFY